MTPRIRVALLPLCLASLAPVRAQPLQLTIDAAAPGKEISPDLVGIFFEDINYAADGGLYAELVQNRSFEYTPLSNPKWNNLTAWEIQERGGRGRLALEGAFPIHPNNPHYGVMQVEETGEVALINDGFDGIPVRAGESYDFSVFAQRLYAGGRWDWKKSDAPVTLIARLEAKSGKVLAETSFSLVSKSWTHLTASLSPSATDDHARLVLLMRERGGCALDEVSLFPHATFRGQPNGLRADLATAIAELKPKFVRFPGGCLAHGDGVPNFYRWKDTIGPVEQRRQQFNLWGYHQTVGLGYFEYFQFCEDIGAKPLPVLAAGVSCQNSGHMGGVGQGCVAIADMPAYIQDILDLIEWANGPDTSTWGAKRAAAGHPAPFGLKYLGIGNEDHITPEFEERFRMIYDAVRAKHPEITIIGTVGPFPAGEDYEAGWKIADTLKIPIVDEHYYEKPSWFWENLRRYDAYSRSRSAVYAGEYAAHDANRRSTLRSALAEAAHLTSLERNGDVVRLASYAPLLARRGHTQWTPDLIYFDSTHVYPTLNYEVQKLFSVNGGDRWVESQLTPAAGAEMPRDLAYSTVRNSASGEVILKIVNGAGSPRPLHLQIKGLAQTPTAATRILFANPNADVANEDGQPSAVVAETTTLSLTSEFDFEAPANSLTVFRFKTR